MVLALEPLAGDVVALVVVVVVVSWRCSLLLVDL